MREHSKRSRTTPRRLLMHLDDVVAMLAILVSTIRSIGLHSHQEVISLHSVNLLVMDFS